MKKTIAALAVGLAGLATAGNALAGHRNHLHFGISVGPPWGHWHAPAPWVYGYPPPVYYPPVIIQQPPPVYVEQGPPPPAAAPAPPAAAGAPQSGPASWWYYCADPPGYYPYVRECPGGWQRVAPQPQDARP